MPEPVQPRFQAFFERIERPLSATVILAAVATIPLIALQEQPEYGRLVLALDWLVWFVFLFEYLVMMWIVSDRWEYTRRSWLNVAVIVLSFPALPHLMATVRVVRVARLARLLVVTVRALGAVRATLASRGLASVVALSLLLTIAGGSLFSVIEPETVGQDFMSGIWWAIVTLTTVGYGDIAPVTNAGRGLAVILMLAGLGLISTLAASISTVFIGSEENQDFDEMRERLGRMEALLERVAERNGVELPTAPLEKTQREPSE